MKGPIRERLCSEGKRKKERKKEKNSSIRPMRSEETNPIKTTQTSRELSQQFERVRAREENKTNEKEKRRKREITKSNRKEIDEGWDSVLIVDKETMRKDEVKSVERDRRDRQEFFVVLSRFSAVYSCSDKSVFFCCFVKDKVEAKI